MLKIGTQVRINENCSEECFIGLEGKIAKTQTYDEYQYRVDFKDYSNGQPWKEMLKEKCFWFKERDLDILPGSSCLQL